LGKKYNQESVLDWERHASDIAKGIDCSDEWFIDTGGTGVRRR
jgi:hypothetical protein